MLSIGSSVSPLALVISGIITPSIPVSKYKVGYLDHLAYKVKSSTPYSTKLNGVEKSLSKYQPSK